MTRRVLVTGATGFIGRFALAPLLERGFDVHAVHHRSAPAAIAGVHWHRADLLDVGDVRALTHSVKATDLLHLAWDVTPGRFWSSSENLRWLASALELTRWFAEAGGRRLVAAGTCAEYAWDGTCCSERASRLDPATLYGVAKNALHQTIAAYAATVPLSYAWGRIFLLYGPGEAAGRLVSSVIDALAAGEPARCSHGAQIRDVLHVADVAEAFVALLASEVVGPVNVASGETVALRDLVHAIAARMGRPDLVRLGAIDAPANDPPVLRADVQRLRDEVGWSPRYTLAAGLADTIAWRRASLGED